MALTGSPKKRRARAAEPTAPVPDVSYGLVDPAATATQTELAPSEAPPPDLRVVAVDAIVDSPFQHRREYSGLEELAASIRVHGVLQPLVVRPSLAPPQPGGPAFELVCGHRRVRAARLAGLAEVPVLVRMMDDTAVIEAQLIENVQRSDVSPLDESDAYFLLADKIGREVPEIARAVGRSEALVRRRLRLQTLVDDARSRLQSGDILLGHAELIAALPGQEQQKKALAYLTRNTERTDGPLEGYRSHEHVPLAAFQSWVSEALLVRLEDASFDTADAELVPSAGACTSCPKRTGAQRALFPDAVGDDTCSDPPCFWLKTKVRGTRTVEAHVANGARLVPAKQAKALFREDGSLEWKAGQSHVDLGETCYEAPGRARTWGQVLGVDKALAAGEKLDLPVSVAQDRFGRVHVLVDRSRAAAALNKKKKAATEDREPDAGEQRDRARRKRERELARSVRDRWQLAFAERMRDKHADRYVVRLLAWLLRERVQRGTSLFVARPVLLAWALRLAGDDAKLKARLEELEGREQQDLATRTLLVWLADFLKYDGNPGAESTLARAALVKLWVELETAPDCYADSMHAFMTGSVPWRVSQLVDVELAPIVAAAKKDRGEAKQKTAASSSAPPRRARRRS